MPMRLSDASLVRAFKGRRDIAHEAIHLLLHLRMRLQSDVEIKKINRPYEIVGETATMSHSCCAGDRPRLVERNCSNRRTSARPLPVLPRRPPAGKDGRMCPSSW